MFKLVFPTAVDPPGLQLLQSIRDVVDIDSVSYKIEEYSNVMEMVTAIQTGKYPVIVAENQRECKIHAMVAYGVARIGGVQFVKCKNSLGQDPTQPGHFHKRFESHKVKLKVRTIKLNRL